MRYILDTDILIYLIKNRPPGITECIDALPAEDVLCMSFGTPIGGHDLWIACHALAENATLVTHNAGEFERVHGPTVVSWVASWAKNSRFRTNSRRSSPHCVTA